MMRSTTLPAAALFLALGLGCHPKGAPDQEIRDTLSKAATALEAGDASGATAILDDRYQGPEGMNKAATAFYLMQVLKQGKVGVTLTDQDIGINGEDAFEKIHVILTQQGAGLLPDGSRKVYILHWVKRGSDWRVTDIQDFTDRPEGG
ncbi:MAG TPA: hypothetical protein VFF76_10730 [Holophagaceae bacterium]|jgi:hypothetical protein|nr:hypothetical protein [Holophagaceae bacterium]